MGRLQSKGKYFGHQRGRKAHDMRVTEWFRNCFEGSPSTGKRGDVLVMGAVAFWWRKEALVHKCSSWLIKEHRQTTCSHYIEPLTQRLLPSLNCLPCWQHEGCLDISEKFPTDLETRAGRPLMRLEVLGRARRVETLRSCSANTGGAGKFNRLSGSLHQREKGGAQCRYSLRKKYSCWWL